MTKTKQDSDVFDRIGTVYNKIIINCHGRLDTIRSIIKK